MPSFCAFCCNSSIKTTKLTRPSLQEDNVKACFLSSLWSKVCFYLQLPKGAQRGSDDLIFFLTTEDLYFRLSPWLHFSELLENLIKSCTHFGICFMTRHSKLDLPQSLERKPAFCLKTLQLSSLSSRITSGPPTNVLNFLRKRFLHYRWVFCRTLTCCCHCILTLARCEPATKMAQICPFILWSTLPKKEGLSLQKLCSTKRQKRLKQFSLFISKHYFQ